MSLSRRALAQFERDLRERAASPNATPADHNELAAFEARKKARADRYRRMMAPDAVAQRKFRAIVRGLPRREQSAAWESYQNSGVHIEAWERTFRAGQRRDARAASTLDQLVGVGNWRINRGGTLEILVALEWHVVGAYAAHFPTDACN